MSGALQGFEVASGNLLEQLLTGTDFRWIYRTKLHSYRQLVVFVVEKGKELQPPFDTFSTPLEQKVHETISYH
jgi:hypothetical protein